MPWPSKMGAADDAQELQERMDELERQLEYLRTGWDRATAPP